MLTSRQSSIRGSPSSKAPPGTGKTRLVTELIKSCKQRIMVCAPSNGAVHEMLARYLRIEEVDPSVVTWIVSEERMAVVNVTMESKGVAFCTKKNAIERIWEQIKLIQESTREGQPRRLEVLKKASGKIVEGLQELGSSTMAKEMEEKIEQMGQGKDEKNEALAEIMKLRQKSFMGAMTDSVLKESHVVFCTLSVSCSMKGKASFGEEGFPTILVDEACQSSFPECFCPLTHPNTKRLWLVGDPKQLPAVVNNQEAKKVGYDRSLFEYCQHNGSPPFLLDTQYRMAPEISHWPSNRFYASRLKIPLASTRGMPPSWSSDQFFFPLGPG